jgi:cell division inhibitor SepF
MASVWRKTMVLLGLQDDEEEYGADYDYEPESPEGDSGTEPRAARPPAPRAHSRDARIDRAASEEFYAEPTVRALPRDEPPSGVTVARPATVRTVPTTSARVHVVEPRGFDDAQEVGDRLKADQPVILNLQGLGRDLQRRLIDFSSGLAYALNGRMQRVADQVFLISPTNIEVSQEEKERLQARGLYRD